MTNVEELAPRTTIAGRRRLLVVGGLIATALGFLLVQGLGNATVYFKTADEAVAERAELGDRRFRIEGRVVPGSVDGTDDGVRFRIESAGVQVPVVHRGSPPELFQDDIPVVLEGRFRGEVYESDEIMVRHTSEYKAEHPDRVADYQEAEEDK